MARANTPERHWLAPKEVAHELRLDVSTVYKAIRGGALPAFRLTENGALRVPHSALSARTEGSTPNG
jgi:helix-turn-helix protein